MKIIFFRSLSLSLNEIEIPFLSSAHVKSEYKYWLGEGEENHQQIKKKKKRKEKTLFTSNNSQS